MDGTGIFMLIFTGFSFILALVAIILSVVAIINSSNIPDTVIPPDDPPDVPPVDPPDSSSNKLFYETITAPVLPSNYFQYDPGQMILEQVLGGDLTPIPRIFLSGDADTIYYNMETFITNDLLLESPRLVQTVYANSAILSRTNIANDWLEWNVVNILPE